MGKRPAEKHLASASLAGSLFQLERALCHLASADIDAVGVEHVDDVATFRDDQVILQEQDKHTIRRHVEIVGDRSLALWRTLQIWVGQRRAGSRCGRYLLAVNTEANGNIARQIKRLPSGEVTPAEIVTALRKAGVPTRRTRTSSSLQSCIDDVLSEDDMTLEALLSKIEIVDGRTSTDWRSVVIRGAGLDDTVDQHVVLQGVSGWLGDTLIELWRAGQPGLVTRKAFIRQCRVLERSLVQRRLLPRPASEVPVAPADRSRTMARRFVDHLARIGADREDVVQAVDHFLQFAAERWRLAKEGGIPRDEWKHRGDRLQQRWANIARAVKREHSGQSNHSIGQAILARTTYDHLEAVNGLDCRELYMTSGHYHRLADDDKVWWSPDFLPDHKSDDAT